MRRIIYLSGPITGDDGYQRKFIDAADQLLEIDPNLIIVDPATMFQLRDDIDLSGNDYRRILEIDKQILSGCDAICLLPGWETSKGCREEVEMAISEDLDIFIYNDPELLPKLRAALAEP